jgi:hypothetical protein
VTAQNGAQKSGVDFALEPAALSETGRITGQVLDDETGAAVPGAVVRAWSSTFEAQATTDSRGFYTIDRNDLGNRLPSGDYRVTAELAPYFPSDYGGGALVRVTADSTTSGIDFRLIRLQVLTVSPASGPLAGGTGIAITGKHFTAGAKVRIGDADAQILTVTPTQIVAITPPGPAGAADVTVSLSSSVTTTLANGFVYTPGSSKRRSARH